MRILVHEYASGGGLAGRDVPASLGREGAAMVTALLDDLAALRQHQIVTTVDPRFQLTAPAGVTVVPLAAGDAALFDDLIAASDAVWLIAPESDRSLERLAAKVERAGKTLLGSGAAAIRRASDKADLPRRFAARGIPHPTTRVVHNFGVGAAAFAPLALRRASPKLGRIVSEGRRATRGRPYEQVQTIARQIGFPLVVKPARGAGCNGVYLARNARELRRAADAARRVNGRGSLLVQRYVPGVAASVSLVADGRRAVALAVNAQWVRVSRRFSYRGGRTPIDHPLAERAMDVARRACEAFPGLRGYIGVDVVLTRTDAIVIEVNPRLTTSYLGVRSAFGRPGGTVGNIAAMTIAACAGRLLPPPPLQHVVRFSADGRIAR